MCCQKLLEEIIHKWHKKWVLPLQPWCQWLALLRLPEPAAAVGIGDGPLHAGAQQQVTDEVQQPICIVLLALLLGQQRWRLLLLLLWRAQLDVKQCCCCILLLLLLLLS
jgi:hypothetical protein